MISRRDKLLKYPWEQQRYEQHRQKVRSAKPAIDVRTPPIYTHVITKSKKLQTEKERLQKIEMENVRLLQRLGDIMRTKRLENVWLEPRPNFLNREKLFDVYTETSLPKWVAIYKPQNGIQTARSLKAPHAKTAQRCPSCSGKPEITEVYIPEPRIPWQPMRQTWNVKSRVPYVPEYCMHCNRCKVQVQ